MYSNPQPTTHNSQKLLPLHPEINNEMETDTVTLVVGTLSE